MSNSECEKLRKALLAKGVTAPKSWNKSRLEKELAKFNEGNKEDEQESEKQAETTSDDNSSDKENGDLEISIKKQSPDEDDNESQEDDGPDTTEDDLDESAGDAEDLDQQVWVRAKVDFTNTRLNLGRKQPSEKFTVSPDVAEFLVTIDRTCEYLND